MDPSQEVLRQCSTFGHCFAAAGLFTAVPNAVPTAALTALLAKMGAELMSPSNLLAVSTDTQFDQILEGWEVPAPTDEDQAAVREANFMEVSAARLARRYARLHHGVEQPVFDVAEHSAASQRPESLPFTDRIVELRSLVELASAPDRGRVCVVAGEEGIGKSRLVDDAPASHVDDALTRLRPCKQVGIEQTDRLGCAGEVQRDEVGGLDQLVQPDQ